jgi:hypothetical protein
MVTNNKSFFRLEIKLFKLFCGKQFAFLGLLILTGITSFSQLAYKIKADTVQLTGNIKVNNLATGLTPPVTTGNTKMVVTDANGQLSFANMPSGSGTVTSIGITVPSWLSVSGSPVTNSGTIALSAATGQTPNQFLATPNGSSGAVGLRSIVAGDIPALDASKITTGILATSRLGSGTADNTTYLGGDQVYHSALLSKAISFQSPTASENVSLWYTPVALTISQVGESIKGTSASVTYNIRFAATRDAASPTAVFSTDRAVTSTSGTTVSSFANASIPAGSWIWITTSATSGTVNDFNATIIYRQ